MNGTQDSRDAYTCIGNIGNHVLYNKNNYNFEEAEKCAIVASGDVTIDLMPEEKNLFQLFEDTVKAYEQKKAPFEIIQNEENGLITYKHPSLNEFNLPKDLHKPIEVRIAGGWVRDKIMKQASHDVDIALDSMSGHQFAILVQQYLIYKQDLEKQSEAQEQTRTQTDGRKSKSKKPRIAVIAANPSQSKHLETATITILGIDCDFVHLRGGETYTSDSRIPTLKSNATALDDALRRDFTVNSLFYNLRRRHVEDWTGRGVQDLLKDKLLVTPLDARITFNDDPLRVLRAIRFAVRYDLKLSDEIVHAAMSPEVHHSLHVKVSRERVGKELEGMLSGKNARPNVALKLMTELKLIGCVFEFPGAMTFKGSMLGNDYGLIENNEDKKLAREKSWLEATELLRYCSPVLASFENEHEGFDLRIFYLSIFLLPLRNLVCTDAKGKEFQLPTCIIRDSIKYSNKDTNSVTTLLRHIDEMRSILRAFDPSNGSGFSRLESGLLIRNLKDLWVTVLAVATTAEIRASIGTDSDTDMNMNVDEMSSEYDKDKNAKQIATWVEKAKCYQRTVQESNLDGCWKIRPLLDGKAILKSLDLPRGPIIGIYLQEQVKWMLMNPKGTKDACELHLKAAREAELEKVE